MSYSVNLKRSAEKELRDLTKPDRERVVAAILNLPVTSWNQEAEKHGWLSSSPAQHSKLALPGLPSVRSSPRKDRQRLSSTSAKWVTDMHGVFVLDPLMSVAYEAVKR